MVRIVEEFIPANIDALKIWKYITMTSYSTRYSTSVKIENLRGWISDIFAVLLNIMLLIW